jgi:hypothetical protein
MDVSLSDLDVRATIPNIVKYEELASLSPEKLMRMLPLAILYQTSQNVGHWTLLLRTPEGIEHFDPYGIIIDKEFQYINMQQPHYLASLLYDSGEKINYSPWKFQRMAKGVNTCGRWIILRNSFSNWPIDKFANVVDKVSTQLNLTPDEFVVQTVV